MSERDKTILFLLLASLLATGAEAALAVAVGACLHAFGLGLPAPSWLVGHLDHRLSLEWFWHDTALLFCLNVIAYVLMVMFWDFVADPETEA